MRDVAVSVELSRCTYSFLDAAVVGGPPAAAAAVVALVLARTRISSRRDW